MATHKTKSNLNLLCKLMNTLVVFINLHAECPRSAALCKILQLLYKYKVELISNRA